MPIDKLTIEEAKIKLTQTESTLADLEAKNKQAKEAILSVLINGGKSNEELVAIGFKKDDIDAFILKKINSEQVEKIQEGIEKTLEQKRKDVEELKKINAAQVETLKRDIEDKLQEKEDVNDNPKLKLAKKLRRAGLKEEDVELIPEWKTLTELQKMLVVDQISQQALLDIKKTGEERFKNKNAINWKKFNPLGFANKVKHHLLKSIWISKEEKGVIEDFKTGNLKPDSKNIDSIIKRMAKMDLDVVEKDGKPSIEFAKTDPSATEGKKKLVELFNVVANEYAKMPDAWRNEKAAASRYGKFWDKDKSKKHEEFQSKKEQYMAVRGKLLEMKVKELEDSGMTKEAALDEAMLKMNLVDGDIATLQWSNTNPDALSELDKIENEASWKKVFNNENLWKSSYALMGYSLRKGTSWLSLAAAPIVSGVIGGLRANRKAGQKINTAYMEGREEKTFREMTLEERMQIKNAYSSENFKKDASGNVVLDDWGKPIMKDGSVYKPGYLHEDKNTKKGWFSKLLGGKEVNTKEMVAFVDADSQIQRLNNLVINLENAREQDKPRIASAINARIAYIQGKHEQGLINYGTVNAIDNNYQLFEIISKAAVAAHGHETKDKITQKEKDDGFIDTNTLQNIEERRDELLYRVMRDNRLIMDDRQAEYKVAEIKRGIAVAAGIGTFGRLVGFFREHVNFGQAGGVIDAGGTKLAVNNATEIAQIDKAVADSADSFIIKPPRPSIESVTTTEIEPVIAKNDLTLTPENQKIVDENTITKPSKNIEVDQEDITKVTGENNIIPKKPEIVDEVAAKEKITGEVSNENIDLSGAHQVTENGNIINTETVVAPKVTEDDIDLSGARKVPGTEINTKELDKYGLPPVLETETPIIVDDNIRPTKVGGFNNENIGSGKVIKPTEAVGGYNTGEEKGNIYPRTGALKGGPNAEPFSREVPMTDREEIPTNRGKNVFDNNVEGNKTKEILSIEEDPKHFENAKEIRQTFGNKTVLIDKAEYPTLDQVEDGVDYNDWNTANDNMFEQKGLEFNSYEDFSKERELQELFGTNTYTENPAKIVYDQNLGRNVEIPKHVSITQEYFRDMPEWKSVEKIPAKYFFQDDFLNGNKVPQADLDALVKKGIITQNPLTGTYSFSHRNEIERMSAMYKKLVSSKDYEKFIDKVEYKLGNDRPIGNENMETYIKRITAKVYKADDNTLYGFKRPVDWNDRGSWSRDYDGDRPNQDRMMRPISPTRRIYER